MLPPVAHLLLPPPGEPPSPAASFVLPAPPSSPGAAESSPLGHHRQHFNGLLKFHQLSINICHGYCEVSHLQAMEDLMIAITPRWWLELHPAVFKDAAQQLPANKGQAAIRCSLFPAV